MGAGPSNVPASVLRAMSAPLLGHLDPVFLEMMSEIQELLRHVFQTSNRLTFPISGTGTAGMEAAIANFVEPGDEVIVGVAGYFGERICEMVKRQGGRVLRAEAEWGKPVAADLVADQASGRGPSLIAVVHGETSTGVLQPLDEIGALARRTGALLLADTVTSLGGQPVAVDETGIDICYSGSQKCLGSPPGLAPITVSERALKRLARRKSPPSTWYLDLSLVDSYWGKDRAYHHTAPISINYALLEALRLVVGEGLKARWQRHRTNQQALAAGLEAIGLELLVAPEHRLWPLTAVKVPEGVDDSLTRTMLLEKYNIEIGGGLGPLRGKIWRVGLMGASSTARNVMLFLAALEHTLQAQGYRFDRGASTRAASARF